MLLASGRGCTPPGAQGPCWIGECVPGGQERVLGKADLVTLSLEEFFDEVRDIYRDSQAILRILPVSELTWVCSDVDLGDIPSVLICMRHRALWERAWTQFIFIIIVQIYTVLIDKLGGTGKKPCCTGEWRPPVWSLNTFWPRSSKKDGSMRRAEMIKAIWWKWRSIRWIFSISKIVS